jgi:hypothetical protein
MSGIFAGKALPVRFSESGEEDSTFVKHVISGWNKLIRVDYHGSKEVPSGTCHAILKVAGIKK